MLVTTRDRDPQAVSRILRALPAWFGIETAITTYVQDATDMDSYVTRCSGGQTVGVALVRHHFTESAELHLIAVDPQHHNTGCGTSLLNALESDLRAQQTRLLTVHTVGPSYADAAYARTRAFYLSKGFLPVQEFHGIDWEGPTLVLVKLLT